MNNNQEFQKYINIIFNDEIQKIVISNLNDKKFQYKKIVIEKKENKYLISSYTDKQVFNKNIEIKEIKEFLQNYTSVFKQFNFFSLDNEYMIRFTKKNKIIFGKSKNKSNIKISTSNNREKNYIIKEGMNVEPLVDMGIFTKEGKIVSSMQDKYRQINRFLEIIDDQVKKEQFKKLNIIDFGCGKSYLTFVDITILNILKILMLM